MRKYEAMYWRKTQWNDVPSVEIGTNDIGLLYMLRDTIKQSCATALERDRMEKAAELAKMVAKLDQAIESLDKDLNALIATEEAKNENADS